MFLTLGQAAKATGKSKTAISNAIKSGRLSAIEKGPNGYKIDPAELNRVYPVTVTSPSTVDDARPPQLTGMDPAEKASYEAQIKLLREMLEEVRGERDHLRQLQIADSRKNGFWSRLMRKAA